MKILSVLANGTGSAYYRQLLPARAMQAVGYPVMIVDGSQPVPEGTLKSSDVVQISRVAGLDATAVIEHISICQQAGVKIVIDYDDDLLNIPEHNAASRTVDAAEVIKAVRAADGITVTSEALAAVYKPYAKRIGIIPNYIDVASWPKFCPPADKITIGLVGSASHHLDWRQIAEPMRRIREEFDVEFLIAGYLPDYLKDVVTEYVPWQDVFTYQATVNRIDIGLCPLLDDTWNLKKTPIKALELGMAGAAVVASPTLYRSVVQGRGTLARTEDDWYQAIKRYIEHPDLRKRDAEALHNYVIRRCDVRKHASEIYNVYRNLFKGTVNGKRQHQCAVRI